VGFGVYCDGYAQPVSIAKLKTQPAPRTLVPKDMVKVHPILVRQIHTGPDFSGEEARYFRYYCEDVASQLSGAVETTLWDRIIPQAVETEPIIRHAVVALAALNKSRIDSAIHGIGKSNPHHQYALLQYGKALKKIRDALDCGVQDPRRALMACLLVFCLESLQLHQTSASNQASVGVNLLQRWCIENKGTYAHYHAIEEDICHGLSSLDLQALLFLDTRTAEIHRDMQDTAAEVMCFRPLKLQHLKDCYLYWQLIMKHCYHFIAAAHLEITRQDPSPFSDKVDFTSFKHGDQSWCVIVDASKDNPASLQTERDACVENVRRWERASKDLVNQALKSGKETDEYIIAAMLKIQVAMTLIALGTVFSQSEMDYDRFAPDFNAITTFSESIYPALVARDRGSMFHFNVGILPGLCQVGMWCRHKEIRARAIDLLLKSPEMQEGVWHSGALGNFVDFLSKAEEAGADEGGFVSASKRISWAGSSISLYEKMLQNGFAQRNGDSEVCGKG
jgi:hypothetical protein